jgi:hypothetical protein
MNLIGIFSLIKKLDISIKVSDTDIVILYPLTSLSLVEYHVSNALI